MKNCKALLFAVSFLFIFAVSSVYSEEGVKVDFFSPQGNVKKLCAAKISIRNCFNSIE